MSFRFLLRKKSLVSKSFNSLKYLRRFTHNTPNYEKFLSQTAKQRQPSPTREMIPLMALPGMISFSTGVPNPDIFPFKSLSFQIDNSNLPSFANSTNATKVLTLTDTELKQALQYSPTPGLPSLVQWLKNFHAQEHKLSPSDDSWDICLSTGSQDLLTRVMDVVLEDPEDIVLIESPTFSGTLAYLNARTPQGLGVIGVDCDRFGIKPDLLERALNHSKHKPHRNKLLYLIPTGQNPSGMTYSLERRKQVYEIACKHNVLILEDDPYYYLHFGEKELPQDISKFTPPQPIPSFQSIDTEKRVIRVDSLSKTLSAGIRLGYVTGPKAIVNKVILHMQATCLHTSGVSQMLVSKLLHEWGESLFKEHLKYVSFVYGRKRDMMGSVLSQNFGVKNEWIKYDIPTAGMFYWLKIVNEKSSFELQKAVEKKVLMLPGKSFYPKQEITTCGHTIENPEKFEKMKKSFVRAAFSIATDAQMKEGMQRFKQLLQSS